jgi:acyl CoA:acetate/3-ketoacid CoA transferase alpha subunit
MSLFHEIDENAVKEFDQIVTSAMYEGFNICVKTFVTEGGQPALEALVDSGCEDVVEEISDMVDRGLLDTEIDVDFLKKMLAMYGTNKVFEKKIIQKTKEAEFYKQRQIQEDIELSKPL